MRFFILATAFAAGSALAAPVASPASGSSAPATSDATKIIKNLNTQLQGSASNIKSIVAKENDKQVAGKDISAELQKMTGSIKSTVGQIGGATGVGMEKVAKRDVPTTPEQIKQMDSILADRIKESFSFGHLDLDLPIIPEKLPSDGKALSKGSKRDVPTTPEQIKQMDSILADRIKESFSFGHLDLDLPIIPEKLPSDGKASKMSKNSKRNDASDLNDAMKTTVDTVSDATDSVGDKLGSDAPTADMIALYGALTSLTTSITSLTTN